MPEVPRLGVATAAHIAKVHPSAKGGLTLSIFPFTLAENHVAVSFGVGGRS